MSFRFWIPPCVFTPLQKIIYSNGLFQPGEFCCALSGVLRGLEGRSAAAQHLLRVSLQSLGSGAQKAADGASLHGAAVLAVNIIDRLRRNAQPASGGADAVKAVRRPADLLLRLLHRPV